MALFEKWNEAWNKNDAAAVFECFHDDFEFKFHSSGNVMKKSDMSVEMMTKMMLLNALPSSKTPLLDELPRHEIKTQ